MDGLVIWHVGPFEEYVWCWASEAIDDDAFSFFEGLKCDDGVVWAGRIEVDGDLCVLVCAAIQGRGQVGMLWECDASIFYGELLCDGWCVDDVVMDCEAAGGCRDVGLCWGVEYLNIQWVSIGHDPGGV